MAKKLFFMALLLITCWQQTNADIIVQGFVPRQFSFTNLNNYKDYKFIFNYITYHYDKGYQPDIPVEKSCKNNERYLSGTRFAKTYLVAINNKGLKFKSDIEIGGSYQGTDPQLSSVVDVYSVVAIKDSIISINKQKEILVYKDGREKENKATEAAGIFNGTNSNGGLITAAVIAIIILTVLFFTRRKKENDGGFQIAC